MVASRPLGGVWLLDALWRRLELAQALRELLGARRFATDVERVLFALVANRALAPCSKLAAAEWASEDVAIPGLGWMDDDQTYRALDLLVEADAEATGAGGGLLRLRRPLESRGRSALLRHHLDLFEAEPDVTGEGQEGPGALPGARALEGSPPRPAQVVISLALTREGIPVRGWVSPGNTNDQTVIAQVKDDLRGWPLGLSLGRPRLSSDQNLRCLTRGGGHWIAGERMREAGAVQQTTRATEAPARHPARPRGRAATAHHRPRTRLTPHVTHSA